MKQFRLFKLTKDQIKHGPLLMQTSSHISNGYVNENRDFNGHTINKRNVECSPLESNNNNPPSP